MDEGEFGIWYGGYNVVDCCFSFCFASRGEKNVGRIMFSKLESRFFSKAIVSCAVVSEQFCNLLGVYNVEIIYLLR